MYCLKNKPGHLTTMSDVYSFGVVLLEILTGRRCMDKKRPKKEQSLVEWGRPLLKDPRKIEGLMDPRLDGQYSIEGSKIAAQLAYQCLSKHPKTRPKMSAVIKVLEPLLELNDMPFGGTFVYVVPKEGTQVITKKEQSLLCDVKDEDVNIIDVKNEVVKVELEEKEVEIGENNKQEEVQIGEKQRIREHRRSLRSRAVKSDSDLCKAQQ